MHAWDGLRFCAPDGTTNAFFFVKFETWYKTSCACSSHSLHVDGGSQNRPCDYFFSSRGCRKGDSCEYSHMPRPGSVSVLLLLEPSHYFVFMLVCKLHACKFSSC